MLNTVILMNQQYGRTVTSASTAMVNSRSTSLLTKVKAVSISQSGDYEDQFDELMSECVANLDEAAEDALRAKREGRTRQLS